MDFSALGVNIDENKAETAETEEPKQEQKPKEPEKPKVDHSIPPRQRIEEERSKLKFESAVFGSMQRYAAKIIGDMILWEFDNYPEREQEWDYNEWTLVDFLEAFAKEAHEAVEGHGNQALFAGRTEDENDPTMELVRSIIHRKNKPTKPDPKPTPTTPTAPPTPKAKKQEPKPEPKPKKEEPKKDHEQLMLDFGALFK